jgi:hypothetical protein
MSSETNIPFRESDPDFLVRFRGAAAGFIKDLIVARSKQQPRFLSDEICQRWGISQTALPAQSCEYCLQAVKAHLAKIHQEFVGYGDSIRSPESKEDDRLERLRESVATLVNSRKLDTAIERARRGLSIDWAKLARWNLLSDIREGLDELPRPNGKKPKEPPTGDGPFPPDGFRYGGREERIDRYKVWKLVNYLWTCRNRTSAFEDLAQPVWGEKETIVGKDQVGSLRRDANHFFEEKAWPFRVQIKNDYVSLVGPTSDG